MICGIGVIKFVAWLVPTLVSAFDKPCESIIPCLLKIVGLNFEMTHSV
jgi:hypothetical protein